MKELVQILALIDLINGVTKPFEVTRQTDGGETVSLGDGHVSLTTAGAGYRLRASFSEDGVLHQLYGEGKITGPLWHLKYVETIKLDGTDVDEDDIYTSSRIDPDSKSILVEFRFKKANKLYHYRFTKIIEA